ncbi:phosphoenolpyruvate--protein phosphotransferase [Loktanella salsilacus]|uniref:phosphoenolpyruvate--protein phosphotransferase n=1 Tax=Loktanella salsilacus TaxID=195913 RepID=UPI0020B7C2FB|nr:phosphoenolpyruvate--protein phosphotransferase [Loktanella salsilacus]UTH43963.1 phosphoenolpyruvate--protein phosphotransferase [Loktanella salsilacus]
MSDRIETESRKLLGRLRRALAEDSAGQERLDRIVELIASSMQTEVCSIYLFRDVDTLELCATEGLQAESVHKTRMRLGEGLVGRVARTRRVVNAADAPSAPGFRYMPETGEERYSSFCGVPIQRLGDALGVLVVQSKDSRAFTTDEVYALEVVAMVLAEMTELGAFVGEGAALSARHQQPVLFRGTIAQEGASAGKVYLHEPRVVVTNPISDDPDLELERLRAAVETLRLAVDELLSGDRAMTPDQVEIFEAYRMFANSRSWMRRMEADVSNGLSAEAAVEKEQSLARSRLGQAEDAYMRDRLHDLDDLSNRLLRILTGQGSNTGAEMPENPILIAKNIGPGELLEYGKALRGIVLEEGSVGSHATIVARAWAIPLVINVKGITTEALNGDTILVDGEQGVVHLRPDDSVSTAFGDKLAMQTRAQERYASLRELPAVGTCGTQIALHMNAGLMADLPSLPSSGAEGVGLFRTELQFLIRSQMPKRSELSALYSRVIGAAHGKRVAFRTLDIGSDKVLPYMKANDEPNPAMGWRAIRVGLDKPGILRMQLQALIRAANGGPLAVMFPFITLHSEFRAAKAELDKVLAREVKLGNPLPSKFEVGAMLETPSLAYAPAAFFKEVDFISVGGNDLKQFFYAADRENELVRRRYDTLNGSFLSFLKTVVERCNAAGTPVSFCGEDAGRPLEALVLSAIGFRSLSMRPASVGPVKHLLRQVDIVAAGKAVSAALDAGEQDIREMINAWLVEHHQASRSVT